MGKRPHCLSWPRVTLEGCAAPEPRALSVMQLARAPTDLLCRRFACSFA